MNNSKQDLFDTMASKWPSTLVARTQVKTFSGGIITGKTLANLSLLPSKGEPVPTAIQVGGKIAYDARELADWLRSRSKRRAA